jgi:predicted ATPase
MNHEQLTTNNTCLPSAETPVNQKWMIMQNKPNFRKAKMKLTFYSTKDYENEPRLRTPRKQTQSKPISNGAFTR